MTSSLLLQTEPEELKILNIDYESLELFEAELYTHETDFAEEQQNENPIFMKRGFISILSTYVVILETQQNSSGYSISWLNVKQWLVNQSAQPLNDKKHENSLILNEIFETTSIIIYVLGNSQIHRLLSLLKQICIIKAPNMCESYQFIRNLGEGSQASVDLYELRENEESVEKKLFAVKTYSLPSDSKRQRNLWGLIFNEITFLRELTMCDNIVHLEEVYYEESKIHLVMKFAKHGSLLKHIAKEKKFTEEQIRRIMAQLILAADLMHRKNIIHRDIKPENILLMDKHELQICIADLGLACSLDDKASLDLKCGTPGYTAPEILKGFNYTTKSDIFSIGSFFFNMITGKLLFSGKNLKELLLSNKFQDTGMIIDNIQTNVSVKCLDLLRKMLRPDPTKRPSTEECLSHQWFQIDKEALQSSLQINRQSVHFSNLLQPFQNRSNALFEQSFIITPNYFKNLKRESSNLLLSDGSSPQNYLDQFNSSFSNTVSPANIRFNYNEIISQNRNKRMQNHHHIKESYTPEENNSLSFVNFLETQKKQNSDKEIKLIDKLIDMCDNSNSQQVFEESFCEEQLSDNIFENMEEYRYEDGKSTRSEDIDSKVTNRVQITNLLHPDKAMSNKNGRVKIQ